MRPLRAVHEGMAEGSTCKLLIASGGIHWINTVWVDPMNENRYENANYLEKQNKNNEK